MATLILEQADRRRGAVLNGRVVIGRRANSHIAIRDRSVSRIHAWIGHGEEGYFIADSGSRTGTRINGRVVRGRRLLQDGDEVQIGPARIIFHENGSLPPGIEPLDLSERILEDDDGIFLDCECGAPIWIPWDFAGKTGRCRECDRLIRLPQRPKAIGDASNDTMAPGMAPHLARRTAGGARPVLAAAPPARLSQSLLDEGEASPQTPWDEVPEAPVTFCGACQSGISALERTTRCPECGVVFHFDCWTENGGCSSYGCKQVGILPQPPRLEEAVPASPAVPAEAEPAPRLPVAAARSVQWGYLLLPASLLVGLASILSFGAPSLLLAIGIATFDIRRPVADRKVNGIALIISIIAAAAGSGLSTYWWLVMETGGGFRP